MESKSVESSFKLALRHEGNFWRAYLMLRDGDKPPLELGSIAMMPVVADESLKQAFMELMKRTVEIVLQKGGGIDVSYWNEPKTAPESERGGHA